jgi:hypothetical protein
MTGHGHPGKAPIGLGLWVELCPLHISNQYKLHRDSVGCLFDVNIIHSECIRVLEAHHGRLGVLGGFSSMSNSV